ncbi:MAG: polyphosphate polymerase domain-containing protein [Lactobacillaceae bacterium]|jgi:SPX domain protein involved in polyphosphate accumulation|nr:polyphosphate polymerase domain-containing protein [Lactobacillaceae bacterium]
MPQVFNRFEKKYVIKKEIAQRIRQELEDGFMQSDPFNKGGKTYPIASIYYATDAEIVDRTKAALEKHDYNHHLRLRSYGQIEDTQPAFLEIKKKVAGMTNKRRVTICYRDAVRQMSGQHVLDNQVISEVEAIQKNGDLKPYMLVAYDRFAYKGIEDPNFRISFDQNIRYRQHDLDLTKPTTGRLLLDEDYELMEIKSRTGMPMKMISILNRFGVTPQSFSKFSKGAIDMNSDNKISKELGLHYA